MEGVRSRGKVQFFCQSDNAWRRLEVLGGFGVGRNGGMWEKILNIFRNLGLTSHPSPSPRPPIPGVSCQGGIVQILTDSQILFLTFRAFWGLTGEGFHVTLYRVGGRAGLYPLLSTFRPVIIKGKGGEEQTSSPLGMGATNPGIQRYSSVSSMDWNTGSPASSWALS
jgi:hypothetical protein